MWNIGVEYKCEVQMWSTGTEYRSEVQVWSTDVVSVFFSLAVDPVNVYITESVIRGQYDARLTVTFQATGNQHCIPLHHHT